MSTTTTGGSSWFWRWGAPLAAAAGALAAAGFGADLLWGLTPLPRGTQRMSATAASTFSAALLACWLLRSRNGSSRRLPARSRANAVLAPAVVAASAVLASYHLDLGFRIDESFTIASYATQPFAAAMSTYDHLNNHMLHTLLVWVAHQFGGWSRIVLRLPAFLSFCLLLPAVWWFARREYGATAATFATAFAGGSPLFVNYATNARGYTLLLLLFTLVLICGQALVRAPNRKGVWAAWAAAIALGFHALPLMAYPTVATLAWMLLARWRRCGPGDFGLFLARTAAWSAAALAVAGTLYLPSIAAEGLGDLVQMFRNTVKRGTRPLAALLLEYPFALSRAWHTPGSSWAQGVFYALVVAGATAQGRSCGRTGTLPLALCLALSLFVTTRLVYPEPRMSIWGLLLVVVLAGAGAASVFESTVARAAARWPRIASAARLSVLECASVAVLFGALSWWVTRPGSLGKYKPDSRTSPLVAMTASVAERMRPGDYIAVADAIGPIAVNHIRAYRAVGQEAGELYSAMGWTTKYQVLTSDCLVDGSDASAASRDEPPRRTFLFNLVNGTGANRFGRGSSVSAVLEAQWPDFELVATFGRTTVDRAGSVYMVSEHTPIP